MNNELLQKNSVLQQQMCLMTAHDSREFFDLSRPLNPSTVAAINNAWMKHIVLVFPSQPISDDALVAFGQ